MKALHIAHAALTALLLASVLLFTVFVILGQVEVRRASLDGAADQQRPTESSGPNMHLLVLRGLRPNWKYSIYDGRNIIGRADDKPVDIDLQPQEPDDRVWSSRQHAAINCDKREMAIEDLNTANGTYVNGSRVPPGEKRPLREGDIIQIGEVHLKVVK